MLASFFASLGNAIRPAPVAPRHLNASPENPSFDLNSPQAWDTLAGGAKSRAGIIVNHKTALTISAVWKSVWMISADCAGMTLNCYMRTEDNDRVIDEEHPAQHAASTQANEETSAFDFWMMVFIHGLMWGNGYAYIGIARDGTISLYNLLPDRTCPQRTKDGRLFYITEVDGQLEPIPAGRVLHLRGLRLCGDAGADMVAFARDTFGQALAKDRFISKFFANGGQAGGVLEVPTSMSPKARQNVIDGFVRMRSEGDEAAFKVALLRENAKFHSTQVTPQQAQMHELDEDQRRAIADFFNLPPSKLGVQGSVSYNSQEQSQLEYLQSTLTRWLRGSSAECNMKLLTPDERKTHYFEHNTSTFIEIDTLTLNQVLEIQRRNGVINANGWLRKINLPPRKDPGGEEYYNPNTTPGGGPNTSSADSGDSGDSQDGQQDAKPPQNITFAVSMPQPPALPPPLPVVDVITREPEPKPSIPLAAFRPILTDLVNRMARRITKDTKTKADKPVKFQDLVESGAAEFSATFDDVLRATAGVVANLKGEKPEAVLGAVHGVFFTALLNGLKPLLDLPRKDLAANVEAACTAFESSIAGEVCDAVLVGDVLKVKETEFVYNALGLVERKREVMP